MLAQLAFARALQSVNNKTTKTIRLARELKSTGRTLSEVVLFSGVVILSTR